jgi:hypothetical protein
VFVLTTTLLPLIKKTATISVDVRVVTVCAFIFRCPRVGLSYCAKSQLSSTTHKLVPEPVHFDSVESFNVELGGADGMPANLS